MSIKSTSFCLCAVFAASEAQAACLQYAPAEVSLAGSISPIMFYGPPNFGEDPKHDKKEIYPVLKINAPVQMCSGQHADFGSDAPQRISSMQMVFHEPSYGGQWNGKRVLVTGTLFPAETGHHHTPVLIDVTNVQAVGSRHE